MCKKNKYVLTEIEKRRFLYSLKGRGYKTPKNYKLLHSEIVTEGEEYFNVRALISKLAKGKKLEFQVNRSDIVSDPNEDSRLDEGVFKVRYRYVLNSDNQGQPRLIATSREFCQILIGLDQIYRIEDISIMSFRGANRSDFGRYSIFRFQGSFGCRHAWQREVYLIERDNEEIENNQIIESEIESE